MLPVSTRVLCPLTEGSCRQAGNTRHSTLLPADILSTFQGQRACIKRPGHEKPSQQSNNDQCFDLEMIARKNDTIPVADVSNTARIFRIFSMHQASPKHLHQQLQQLRRPYGVRGHASYLQPTSLHQLVQGAGRLVRRTAVQLDEPATTSVGQSPPAYTWLLPRQAIALFSAGATLGPFCDGLHSQHNVLHYASPSIQLQLTQLHWSFETCW